jgi:hypothetical protein
VSLPALPKAGREPPEGGQECGCQRCWLVVEEHVVEHVNNDRVELLVGGPIEIPELAQLYEVVH